MKTLNLGENIWKCWYFALKIELSKLPNGGLRATEGFAYVLPRVNENPPYFFFMRNSRTSTKGHLSATATSLQKPFFLADSPYIHSCFNHSTTATSLQWPLCSVAMQGGYGYCSLTNRDSITSIFPEKLAANSSLNQPAPFGRYRQ